MATLEQNIRQAIADFDGIKSAIEEKGIEVPVGTDTKDYGRLIGEIGADQYDRGYEAGYEQGNTEGYSKGHADGLAERQHEVWTITLVDGTVVEKEVALL